ncbi:MAG: AraC family transcriptional regulator [Paenibacillaceae bacterium]|jgi:AraC-like DNA-binding protein|nr:AraC family transcriptional regulator [Paenibacillaceae bacterium]
MSSIHTGQDYDFQVISINHVAKSKPNPEWRYDKANPGPNYVLAYCMDGEAFYYFDGRMHVVEKGDVLFFPKESLRTARSNPDNPWTYYTISFDLGFGDETSQAYLNSIEWILRHHNLAMLQPQFSELYHVWTGKRSGYRVRCKGLLMEILYRMLKERDRSRFNSVQYQAIEKTISLIQSDYTRSYSIEELARHAKLSPSHFRLLFKQITGMTSVQYHNYIRIHKAKDLLLSGECNVTEAALQVGFQDIFYFSRLFKKTLGLNPSTLIE